MVYGIWQANKQIILDFEPNNQLDPQFPQYPMQIELSSK